MMRTVLLSLFASHCGAFLRTRAFSSAVASRISSLHDLKPTQEWDADRYQKQHSFVYEYGSSLVDLANPVEGERILDIGCGTGELTQALYKSAKDLYVSGMDADLEMVNKAQEQFPNRIFFQSDMRDFKVEEPVDIVFSNAALHWVPRNDMNRCVQCISNALKPSGRFVAEFGAKGNVAEITQSTIKVLGLPESANPWYFPSIAEFTQSLENNGIEVTSAVIFDRPTELEDGEQGLRNWLKMFGRAFFENLDEDKVSSALDEIEDDLRDNLLNGTVWTADYRRIRVVGSKRS